MSDNGQFEKTALNQVNRVAKRGHYEKSTVYQVLDDAWICHVGFEGEAFPTIIPMFHVRVGDEVIFHGATTSRLMQQLASGTPVCLSTAMVDGLVLAKSLFHHSMNYRSVVAFGHGRRIEDREEIMSAFKALADKVMPGRWDDARQPSENEIKATSLVAVRIEWASAKIRTGDPADDPADLELPVWAGVVPFSHVVGAAQRASDLDASIPTPEYLESFYELQAP